LETGEPGVTSYHFSANYFPQPRAPDFSKLLSLSNLSWIPHGVSGATIAVQPSIGVSIVYNWRLLVESWGERRAVREELGMAFPIERREKLFLCGVSAGLPYPLKPVITGGCVAGGPAAAGVSQA